MGGGASKLLGGYDLAETSLIGLDVAGKTTMLYQLKQGNVAEITPSIGPNIETILVKKVKFVIMDFSGQAKVRSFWSHYSCRCQCIIFVVDSTDRERIDEAKQMLRSAATNRNMVNCPLLVFANKRDLSEDDQTRCYSNSMVMSLSEITKKLALHEIRDRSTYAIFPCSAMTGEGLHEGLQWLADTFSRIGEKRSKPFEGGAW